MAVKKSKKSSNEQTSQEQAKEPQNEERITFCGSVLLTDSEIESLLQDLRMSYKILDMLESKQTQD
ncbi:hypothetical protein [Calditerrivibrio nitroreducens]|uniref:ADP-ribosylation factor GTPase activating protein 3 n=1 Tax=Calditerrivibrio nitroreducens (strain DSM 19672 / NBRC 101217 / Yu37-1) TaxID=768670 RepID=E4TKB7_CALNY|nr:hypothetical protein [Calditerrivibrio nitroreducens]ADR19989.1 ADP-ribosylation factor GTPase activating protein 3 [Calditerrivibrio nitroreducens DSM 19672]